MRSMIKATSLIAISTLWMASAAVAIPVETILAAPQRVLTNGVHALFDPPGLGAELEIPTLTYGSTKKDWNSITPEQKENLKGATLTPYGFERPQTNWAVTAEIAPGGLITEIIVNGQLNKIGHDNDALRHIGQQIIDYMNLWDTFCELKGSCLAAINPDPAGTNPWEVQWLSRVAVTVFQPQVTTAMPMEGVLQVLKDSKAQVQADVLINLGQDYNKKIIIVNRDSFRSFERIDPNNINDEFLGFFSLLTSYCVAASEGDPAHGPKRGLNIMPRTNFLTMYNRFAQSKLQAQFDSHPSTSLYDIVRELAKVETGRRIDIELMRFIWKPQDLRNPIEVEWPGKVEDMRTGLLPVKKFLDTLQGLNTPQLDLLMLMDKMVRHGQIGGLENRMEGVLGALERPAPIFEFRDLANVNRETLAGRMADFNQQVIALHAKTSPHPTLDQQEEVGQENTPKSGHQDQKLRATESTPPPAKQHNCEPQTEAERSGEGITRSKNQAWGLLSFIRHYSGPFNWFPVDI